MNRGKTVVPDSSTTVREFTKWTDDMDFRLLIAMLDEARLGNRVDGSWTTQAYNNIVEALRQTGLTGITKNNVKNRQKSLKDRWWEVHDLFSGLSGFAWDESTKRFTAEPEVWHDLLQAKPAAAKWRVSSIRYYDLMEELWGVDWATGHMARTARQARRNIGMPSVIVDLNDDVNDIPQDDPFQAGFDTAYRSPPHYGSCSPVDGSQSVPSAASGGTTRTSSSRGTKRKAPMIDVMDAQFDRLTTRLDAFTDYLGQGSVSNDYLHYMLLQFPTNVTGWICHTLVTSSLLKACDGIGAIGRLFIGGQFGSLFDDDPKQWRMYADFIGSAGSIFDLTTQLYPAYFLPLASLGNLTKAVARGLKDPSFRVIQNHFAISGNLGEVAAKEEVWEVVAQLVGLGIGILILDTPGLVKSYGVLSLTWLSMRFLHLWLRYESLSVLQFNTINLKRAHILVKSHVLHSTVPGCTDCNREENILVWSQFMKPKILFGLSLEKMNGVERSVGALLKLYASEKYILMVNQQKEDLRFFVSFKVEFSVGATSASVLRSVWQAFWLSENWDSNVNVCDQIANSLIELEERFEDFIQKLKDAEWDTQQLNLKVPKEILIDDNTNPI
uniref:UPF0420 protein n=1 Tax=Cajanus cajan TaxID=3821 RepID=A0A151T945_CAJCA|nr:UPF0420 protein [Cajanus cajan]